MGSTSALGLADNLQYQDLGNGCREMKAQRIDHFGLGIGEPRMHRAIVRVTNDSDRNMQTLSRNGLEREALHLPRASRITASRFLACVLYSPGLSPWQDADIRCRASRSPHLVKVPICASSLSRL